MSLQMAATALTISVLREVYEKFFQFSSTALCANLGETGITLKPAGVLWKHKKFPESDFTLYH